MNIAQMTRNCETKLQKIGAGHEAHELMQHVLQCSWTELIQNRQVAMSEQSAKALEALIEQRLAGCPLAYILGEWTFFGHSFFVEEGVLIPREETEELVRLALQKMGQKRDGDVLDLCCGSGCIAVTLANENADWTVYAADISEKALDMAVRNANVYGREITFYRSDLLKDISRCFDIIVCNPPYIRLTDRETLQREVRDHEPSLALFGGEDGLAFYRRLNEEAACHLHPGGWLMMEIGYDQREAVMRIFQAGGWKNRMCVSDFAGQDRVILAERP